MNQIIFVMCLKFEWNCTLADYMNSTYLYVAGDFNTPHVSCLVYSHIKIMNVDLDIFLCVFQPFMSPRYPGGPRGPVPVRMPNQVDFNVSISQLSVEKSFLI